MNTNTITKKLDNSLLFVSLLSLISFFIWFLAFRDSFLISQVLMFNLIVILIYFVFGKDQYKSRYLSPKIIGNDINCSYMNTKIIDISQLIPGHIAIPLDGYFDKTFGAVTGNGGVLIMDKKHFFYMNNHCIILKPSVKSRYFSLNENLKQHNELLKIFESQGFNYSALYITYTQDLFKDVNLTSVNSSNLGKFMSDLIDYNSDLFDKLTKTREDTQEEWQYRENVSESKKNIKGKKKKYKT